MIEENLISPSIQEWKELYGAAIEFKEIEPWNWMYDSYMFGVKNPVEGGEIGYCCILGNLGECFALVVYLGAEGLDGYLKIQSGEIEENDMVHINKCLMASFEDRKFLLEEDLKIIKELGLIFTGNNSWPLFRSYKPGYYPWYLTKEEVQYLILCLEQSKEIALRYKKDQNILTPPKSNCYLVRVPKKQDETIVWYEEWLEPVPLRKIMFMLKEVDNNRLKRIEKIPHCKNIVWEIDFSYFPSYVKDRKPYYYPLMFLWVEHNSYFILYTHLTTHDKYKTEFIDQFLNSIENTKILPEKILIRKEELFLYLKPFTDRFKIELNLVRNLRAIEDVRKSMKEFLNKRN